MDVQYFQLLVVFPAIGHLNNVK